MHVSCLQCKQYTLFFALSVELSRYTNIETLEPKKKKIDRIQRINIGLVYTSSQDMAP
jgi:hypothetical protein